VRRFQIADSHSQRGRNLPSRPFRKVRGSWVSVRVRGRRSFSRRRSLKSNAYPRTREDLWEKEWWGADFISASGLRASLVLASGTSIPNGTGVGVGAPQYGPRRGFWVGLSKSIWRRGGSGVALDRLPSSVPNRPWRRRPWAWAVAARPLLGNGRLLRRLDARDACALRVGISPHCGNLSRPRNGFLH